MIPPLPHDLVIPDGVGRFLDGAGALTTMGAPLLVSNSPEQISDRILPRDGTPAILYRTTVPGWRFRLFYHHHVITRQASFVGFALVNNGTRPIEVYLARNSGVIRDGDPAAAGQRALQSYFGKTPARLEPDRYLGTIAPGGIQPVTQRIESGQTTTGQFDIAVRDPGQPGLADPKAPVTLAMLAAGRPGVAGTDSDTNSRNALMTAPVVGPDSVRDQRTRGAFAHADRQGIIRCVFGPDARRIEPRFVDLAGPYSGRFARPLPGEFEPPLAPREPRTLREGNPGNYGVLYNLRVIVSNQLPDPIRVTCLLNAAGGSGGSVLAVDGVLRSPGCLMRPCDSWIWKSMLLAAGESREAALQFSLPGGANGAQRLFFWPGAL